MEVEEVGEIKQGQLLRFGLSTWVMKTQRELGERSSLLRATEGGGFVSLGQ